MKKFLIIILLLLFTPIAYSENWDDYTDLDRIWDGQKSVTNKDFEQVINALQEKGKKKEKKLRKKKIKKIGGGGTSLHEELNPDIDVQVIKPLKPKEEGVLLNVPVNLIVDGKVLEKGYYKILAEKSKEDSKKYVNFYQSQFFKGRLEMVETEDDFGKDIIDFVEVLPFNDFFVKIIFGSIDFNGYAYVPFVE